MKTKHTLFITVLCVIALGLGYWSCFPKEPDFLKKGLVAYYPFNGNAKDESGNNHHATVKGGATLTADRYGAASSAYSFDGTDDSIDSNDTINVPLDSFTYSIWVQPDAYQAGQTWETFISRAVVPADNKSLNWFGLAHHENPRSLRLQIKPHEVGLINWIDSAQGVVTLNQWSHFIGTYDGATAKIYLNGQLVAEGAAPPTPPSTSYKFAFGENASGQPPHEFLSGLVDDIRIYNRALSDDEVKALYDLEKPKGK